MLTGIGFGGDANVLELAEVTGVRHCECVKSHFLLWFRLLNMENVMSGEVYVR